MKSSAIVTGSAGFSLDADEAPQPARASTASSANRRVMRPMTVACRSVLRDEVRRNCADIAAGARHVRIDPHAEILLEGLAGLDAQLHFLEGSTDDVARYVLILDT